MDFDLPEELQILRDTVRRFVDKELIPLEREYRHDSEGAMPERLLKPLQEKPRAWGSGCSTFRRSMAAPAWGCCPAVSFMRKSHALPLCPFEAWNCLVRK